MAFRPFQDVNVSLGGLQDEMNRLFDRVWHAGVSTRPFDGQAWGPVIDFFEQAEQYVLLVEVPGVDANTIDVSHAGNVLSMRGEKAKPASVDEHDRAIHRERRYGAFCRSIDLPDDINADKLKARCHGGVLEITIPKTDANKPKTVKIQVEEDTA